MISPYDRENVLAHKGTVDFYDLVRLLESNGKTLPHEVVHALKKLCYVNGGRGHKSLIQDLKESVWSINKYIEFLEEVDYNPQDLSEEEIEKVIEEHEEEVGGVASNDFDIELAERNGYCFTRAGEKMILGKSVEGNLWNCRVLTDFYRGVVRCSVESSTLREYYATHGKSPNDVLYNELPEDFIGDKG